MEQEHGYQARQGRDRGEEDEIQGEGGFQEGTQAYREGLQGGQTAQLVLTWDPAGQEVLVEIRNVRQWPFALALLDMARKKLEASWEASQANAALLEQQKLVDGQRLAKQIQRGFG